MPAPLPPPISSLEPAITLQGPEQNPSGSSVADEASPITLPAEASPPATRPAIAIPRPLPATCHCAARRSGFRRCRRRRRPVPRGRCRCRRTRCGRPTSQAGRTRCSRCARRRRERGCRCPCPRRSCGRCARRGRRCVDDQPGLGREDPRRERRDRQAADGHACRVDVDPGVGAGGVQADARRAAAHAGAAVDRQVRLGDRGQVGRDGDRLPGADREVDRVRLTLRRAGSVGLHDRRAQRAVAAAARRRLPLARSSPGRRRRVDDERGPRRAGRRRRRRAPPITAARQIELARITIPWQREPTGRKAGRRRSCAAGCRSRAFSRARIETSSAGARSGARCSWRAWPRCSRPIRCSSGGNAERLAALLRAQHGRRAPVAGQAAVVRAEQDEVRGDGGGERSSSAWTGSSERTAETATSVGARSSFGAASGPAASFSRASARGRGRGSATDSSGGGWAPSARGRRARRAARGRPARARKPCGCAACGRRPRAPSARVRVGVLLAVLGVERLPRELRAALVEGQHLERVAPVVVGGDQREAVVLQDALVDGQIARAPP